jgi:hypothetical protein
MARWRVVKVLACLNQMGFACVSSNLILVGILLNASIFLNSTNIQLSPVLNKTRWLSG